MTELEPPRLTSAETASDAVLAQLARDDVLTPALDPHAPIPEPSGLATTEEILTDLDNARADR